MSLLRHLLFAEVNHSKHEFTKDLNSRKQFPHQACAASMQALDNFWKLLKKSMPKFLHACEIEADARVSQRLWSYACSCQFRWNAQGNFWKAVARLIR